jgi:(p)ppGpp synthase/HD superfamily hydrolase
VVTGKARATIRHFLKNLQIDEAHELGKRMLERELESHGLKADQLDPELLGTVLANFKIEDLDRLYVEVGLGNRPAPLVVRMLLPEDHPPQDDPRSRRRARALAPPPVPLAIRGTEGMVVTFPKCCYPLPGDSIVGFLTAGRGIVVHQQHCANVADYRSTPEKWIDVQWAPNVEREFSVELSLDVINRRGTLATIAAAVADADANIEDVTISERNERNSNIRFVINVRDRKHLADVIRTVRHVKTVVRVARKKA